MANRHEMHVLGMWDIGSMMKMDLVRLLVMFLCVVICTQADEEYSGKLQ